MFLNKLDSIGASYLDFLWASFMYDMGVFSQSWMYYPLMIPAGVYFIFFMFKWTVLTAPVTVPVFGVFGGIGKFFTLFVLLFKIGSNKRK
jgi:hypothetical protein